MNAGFGKTIGAAAVAISGLLAATRPAEAQYAATANTGTGVVTFTAGAGNDTPLTFVNAAGVLTHNRSDAGFNSFVDMDTATAGDQIVMVASLTSLTVNAGAGDDTVVLTGLTGVAAGTTITVNGEDGNDILTGGPADEDFNGGAGNDLINPGAANGEANTLNGGPDVDSLVLTGDLNANVVQVTGTGATLTIMIDAATSTATYSNLETVSLTGLAGNDIITVEPINDLAYALDGGADADTLNVDAGGNVVVQTPTTITVGGNLPITHTAVETVNVTNPGFSLSGKDGAGCGLLGIEVLLMLALARSRRARAPRKA